MIHQKVVSLMHIWNLITIISVTDNNYQGHIPRRQLGLHTQSTWRQIFQQYALRIFFKQKEMCEIHLLLKYRQDPPAPPPWIAEC